jgi:flavoprotein
MENQPSIAIHESKDSEKVVRFLNLNVESLSEFCSVNYAKSIIAAQDNGSVYGVYFTASGRIRANFI